MDTTQTAQRQTITHREWVRTHADYKCGSIAGGDTNVLRMTATGTALVPVVVV